MRQTLVIVALVGAALAAGNCKKKAQESGTPPEPTGQTAAPTTPAEPAKATEPTKPPEPAVEPTEPTEPAKVEGPAAVLDKAIEAGGLDNLKASSRP